MTATAPPEAPAACAPPQISVVVPTYCEAENLPLLAEQLAAALNGVYSYEVIVSDDSSPDNTREVCAALAQKYPLRLLSRAGERGLSPAVIEGIGLARGELVAVMDADLSHPPERLPNMAKLLFDDKADFVVGSRYVAGGGMAADWPWWRRLNSLVATLPARPLAPLADPMSGFFVMRRAQVPPPAALSPIGYKIGLELLVKSGIGKARVAEAPIYFRNRAHGESKLTLREQINYLRHLRRLYHYRWQKRAEFAQFLAVGGLGFVVDVAFYMGLQALGMPHLWARAAAYWPAVSCNWFVNRVMTFKERSRERPLAQWGKFAIFCGAGFFINWGVYAALATHVGFFAENLLLALVAGVAAGAVFNFVVSDLFVFKRK